MDSAIYSHETRQGLFRPMLIVDLDPDLLIPPPYRSTCEQYTVSGITGECNGVYEKYTGTDVPLSSGGRLTYKTSSGSGKGCRLFFADPATAFQNK